MGLADFLAVLGVLGTFGFGGVSLWQLYRDLREGATWKERKRHVQAVKHGMVQLRAMLVEASETGEVIKTDQTRQFVRQIGHNIKTIEHHIDAMLDEPNKPAPL